MPLNSQPLIKLLNHSNLTIESQYLILAFFFSPNPIPAFIEFKITEIIFISDVPKVEPNFSLSDQV